MAINGIANQMEYYGLDWIPGCVNLCRAKVIKGKKAKNKIMERLFFLCIALSLAALVGKWGSTRKIGSVVYALILWLVASVCES